MENQTKGIMKIRIHITKSILQRSMWCGTMDSFIAENCAVTKAVQEVFPNAKTERVYINPFGELESERINLPNEATEFIWDFDDLRNSPYKRLDLPEFSFEIEVPDSVIDKIGISDLEGVIERSETLELVR